MTSIDQARARLAAANSVPSPESLPDGAWSPAALLERVNERRDVMSLDTRAEKRAARPPGGGRRRGLLTALAAAAAVIAAGAIFVFASLTGDDTDVAALSDVEIAELWFDHYGSGDIEAYEAMIHPDATWGPDGGDPALKGRYFENDAIRELNTRSSHYIYVTNATVDATCTSLGVQVRCDRTITSGLRPADVISEATALLVIENGLIVDAIWSGDSPPPSTDPFGLSAYRQWVAENRADVLEELFIAGATIRLDTPEVRELHRQYVAEFLAATGG